ncbi:MAG: GTPase Era [Gammaproteobacteria bacterium]|nr:GTPase Era [Gammaproteobacteria bacterium]
MSQKQYCGMITLVGRPNVGKSTLLNTLLGEKVCITSAKPQTTRHAVLGIHTENAHQSIYVDTPGLHQARGRLINRLMNKTTMLCLDGVDVIGMVVEALQYRAEDEYVLQALSASHTPSVLIINKVDKLKNKDELLPFLESMQARYPFEAMIPVSAKTGAQIHQLSSHFQSLLPEQAWHYPADQVTNRSVRFLCAELIREKIFRLCGQELPYSATVEIESYEENERLDRIHALIVVDKENHKRMVIGDQGKKLKRIATEARLEMETLIGKKIFLACYCKVKSGWADSQHLLKQFGYDNA